MIRTRAFTIVELLVVVAIIALLVGILLPALGKARSQAKVTKSHANLRNLGVAHGMYASDWSDRQFTLIQDNISTYGNSASQAFVAFESRWGFPHQAIFLGWGKRVATGQIANWQLVSATRAAYQPITFIAMDGSGGERFGSFRLNNVQAFNRYVDGRFYSPMWYAPQSDIVMDFVKETFESPWEYRLKAEQGNHIAWTSYCLSPAAMFSPDVMRNVSDGGWQDPWELAAGFRSPAWSQALFPSLKTHMLEHHWLQNRPVDACNPAFEGGTYGGCEPYYFNAAWESSPATLFYDSHVESVGVRQTMRADGRVRTAQTGNPMHGLWSRDTPWEDDGYFISYAYDQAATSFHVLTTDGIRGRNITAD